MPISAGSGWPRIAVHQGLRDRAVGLGESPFQTGGSVDDEGHVRRHCRGRASVCSRCARDSSRSFAAGSAPRPAVLTRNASSLSAASLWPAAIPGPASAAQDIAELGLGGPAVLCGADP
jgi:hypothetical protein